MSYFGPHNHTDTDSNLRLRDSTNKVKDLIEYAHNIGLKGIALTGHESVASSLTATKVLKSHKDDPDWKDFKIGLGNEIYLCTDDTRADNPNKNVFPHFLLISLDNYGHQGIRELSTKAWTQNAFMSVMYRVPTYYSDLEEMVDKYKGHVVGSSACLGGNVSRRLLQYRASGEDEYIWETCVNWVEYMNDLFGKGYFFLELQPGQTDEQIYVNNKLIELSKLTDTPYIISTDAHYLRKEDRAIHKTYLQSKDGDREVDTFYETTYVMTGKEIHEYMDQWIGYDAVQKGLNNTLLIWDMIQGYELEKELHIPYLPRNLEEPSNKLFEKYKKNIPLLEDFFNSPYDSDRHMTRDLLKRINIDRDYQSDNAFFKINECLDYIKRSSEKNKTQWSAYLQQVADYVQIAWEADSLVGPARGSGAGFCLLDMLDITQINPLLEKTKTYPWRFLNPDRVSVLDIDVDIMGSRRDAVIQAMKDVYGEYRVVKVLTLSTEKSRSAILTAARGLGIDNDTASYIASLIIFDRGQPRTLSQMYYGDDDHDPVAEFKREMDELPELWEASQKIEGLVSGIGSHAGGVVIVDEPITNTAALMRTKSGDVVTQFDLHELEAMSLIKIDLLCIDALDKIYATLMLLLKDGVIEWQGSLKETYLKYIGVKTLERDSLDMWKMLWDHKVLSLFQMEKASGKQALALVKPTSVDDLATINSVIRLMAQDKNSEAPLQKFARFHENISLWYKEMSDYGLTQEEQDILKEILEVSYGICEAQEYLVLLTQHPAIGGFDLQWGDRLRRAVAKKRPKDFMELEKEFFDNAKEKNLSKKLTEYVWYVLIYTQRGYGFNKAHTLSYSIVGLQELNLAYKYNIIYWNCANLVVDSGALDEESNDSTNYGKMGVAIGKVQQEGVKVSLPVINDADFGFKPDTANDRIIFGLKGIKDINTDLAKAIIENRPYKSMEDFAEKMCEDHYKEVNGEKEKIPAIIPKSKMISLIKSGCFTELHDKDRTKTMDWYLKKYVFNPCNSLTLSQLPKLKELELIPEKLNLAYRMVGFKKYVLDDAGLVEKYVDPSKKMVKRGYHDGRYILDEQSQAFFKEHFTEDSVVRVQGKYYVVSEKLFTKEVDSYIQPLKDWFASDEALSAYNKALYEQIWEQYATGNMSKWNMQALCYYDAEHELEHINEAEYGIVNFNDLPEEPEPYEWYTRYINGVPKQMPKYKISCLAGTVLNADNNHHEVALLTKYGVVNVKINKGHYAFYNKRISQMGEDGKKHVIEDSWLKRGTLLRVIGIRRGDQFWPMRYNDTIYQHTLNLITEVHEDGTLTLQMERTKLGVTEDE